MGLRERLVELLEERGENVSRAAKRTGLGYATIYNIYHGKRKNPSIDTVQTIADTYGVPVQWLLGEEDGTPHREERAVREEPPEQAVAPNLPDVSFLRPQARALYERAIGSYFTRRWPVPTIERAARELVQRIQGANTLRSRGPGRPELTEEEQAWVLEDGIEEVERAYGPNGVARRY